MLAEFVKSISELATKSHGVKTVDLPANKMMIVHVDGTTETLDKNRLTQSDKIASFTSFCDWVNALGKPSNVIKVSNNYISVATDPFSPHDSDTASMPMALSEPYADLLDWVKAPRAVRPLVRGLRTKLYGTFDDRYLSIFKRLDFSRKNDGSKSVTHTSESMGRSVEMAAQSGAGEIPDTLVFDVKLFDGLPVDSYELRFAVDVDANAETVAITPVGSCIVDALQGTRSDIISRLKAEFDKSLVIECA